MQRVMPRSLFALTIVLLAACGKTTAPDKSAQETQDYIVAVNAPLMYFAQRLAGDDADIRLLAPPDSDPAQWQPGVEEALELQGASLILLNGAGYSSWLDKVAIADNRLVQTGEAFRDHWIELASTVTHSHGPEGEHAHGGYAFTTWMDMRQAQLQAEAVAQSLAAHRPAQAAPIEANLAALLSDIELLHAAFEAGAESIRDRHLIYSHPVYQYFERAYKLPGTSLHWEPDAMPDDEQWRELVQMASDDALFVWEAAPNEAIAQKMTSLGIDFIVIDPGANIGERDWLATQRANTESLSSGRPPR